MKIRRKKALGILYRILFLILLGIIAVIGLSAIPLPDNYKLYAVSSGSMEPNIRRGSLAFVRPAKKYQINDVVTLKTENGKNTLTHRIVNKIKMNGAVAYETKGDANKAKDVQAVLPQEIIGKVFFSIPYLGFPVAYAKTLPGLIILIVIPSTIIIYSELLNIKNEVLRLLRRKKST